MGTAGAADLVRTACRLLLTDSFVVVDAFAIRMDCEREQARAALKFLTAVGVAERVSRGTYRLKVAR